MNAFSQSSLQRVLGAPGCRRLLQRLQDRLRRGEPLVGTITLTGTTEEERAAVAALLGQRPGRGSSAQVSLDRLETNLRDSALAPSLHAAVEAVVGAVENRRATLELRDAAWNALWRAIHEETVLYPHLSAWLNDLQATGLLRKLAHQDATTGEKLLRAALEIAHILPAAGARLASIAARFTGDSHALDAGAPLAALLLRLTPSQSESVLENEDVETTRRCRWAALGIATDELSGPALALNLSPDTDSPLASLLRHQAQHGEPALVPLRLLLRSSLAGATAFRDRDIFVCENPTLISMAADRFGPRCSPFVCTQGMPNAATQTLLRQLTKAGARLRYHGDFDWPGVQIASWLIRRLGAVPWQYSRIEYMNSPATKKLVGHAVPTPWDSSLSEALLLRGLIVHEEAIADTLLEDLSPKQP